MRESYLEIEWIKDRIRDLWLAYDEDPYDGIHFKDVEELRDLAIDLVFEVERLLKEE
jgi:hypothetical protein